MDVEYNGHEVEEWEHLDNIQDIYYGDRDLVYKLEISPPDPRDKDICYVNVRIAKQLDNVIDKDFFFCCVFFGFKITNKGESFTPAMFYQLIEVSQNEFDVLFKQRTKETNLQHYKLKYKTYKELEPQIIKELNRWYKYKRNQSMN